MSLKQFVGIYPDRRRQSGTGKGYLREAPKLSEATIELHVMTLRYLRKYFGESKVISVITLADANRWVDSLASGKLATTRKNTKREYTLTPQTIPHGTR